MVEQLHPDIYLVEKDSGIFPIEASGSTGTGYIIISKRGSIGVPTLVTNLAQFYRIFGSTPKIDYNAGVNSFTSMGWYAIKGDLENRGGRGRIWVTRAGHYTIISDNTTEQSVQASLDISDGVANVITVKALDEGEWGNDLKVAVTTSGSFYSLIITDSNKVLSSYPKVSNDSSSPYYFGKIINGRDYNISIEKVGASILPCNTLVSTSLTGGIYDPSTIIENDLKGDLGAGTGLRSLAGLIDGFQIQLVASPDSGHLLEPNHKAVQEDLDAFSSSKKPLCHSITFAQSSKDLNINDMVTYINTFAGSENSSIYYPNLKVSNVDSTDSLNPYVVVPPVGHIIGIIARTNNEKNIWEASAGTDADVRGIFNVNKEVDNASQDILNPLGVNCIRRIESNLVVWGARTLSDDPKWKEQPVRRTFNLIETGIIKLKFLVFKPIRPSTFRDIERSLGLYLKGFWKAGAMGGDQVNPDNSYFIKCDSSINTIVEEQAKKIVAQFGIRNLHMAEIVEFQISQYDGGFSVTEF